MGFAFGGKYAKQLAASDAGGSRDAKPEQESIKATIPFEVSGEVSQWLQRLTKREGVTKLKSLQVVCVWKGSCVDIYF